MATIRIAATGDKEKGINEINPRFQANALRNIRGIDCGVLANNFYSEDRDYYGVNKVQTDATLAPFRMISCASSGIQIGAGMATAYGYDFQIEESETVSVLDDGETSLSSYINNTSGTRYVFVYLEWDITGDPGIGSVKLHGNGTASIWRSLTTSNANLIDNPRGIYKLPIYRVEITNGTLTYVSWEDMNLCQTITRPQVAEVARFATTPDDADYDAVANVKYVEDKCNENLEKMNDVLNVLYQSFNSTTFYILGVALTAERQNALTVLYAPDSSVCGSGEPNSDFWDYVPWQITTGMKLGELPQIYRPTVDTNVRISFYYYQGTGTYGNSGSMPVNVVFKTNGDIESLEDITTNYGVVSSAKYAIFGGSGSTYGNTFHVGWKNKNADNVTNDLFLCRPVTNNIPDTVKACVPEYFELNKTYTLNIKATDYAKWVNTVAVRYTLQEDVGAGTETRGVDLVPTLNATHTQVTFTTPPKPSADTDDILSFTISATVTNYDNGTDDA